MSAASLLTLVFLSPPAAGFEPVVAPVPDVAAVTPARTPEAMRQAYAEALRKSARRAHPDPYELVPELVALYEQLENADGLAHSEQSRMCRGLETRLTELHGRLVRDARLQKRQQRRRRGRAPRVRFTRNGRQLAGGAAELTRAAELIELIRNTIAPESWQVNGGRGSISYYSPLHVLVIRQTGEVHHQIGGTLKQLQK